MRYNPSSVAAYPDDDPLYFGDGDAFSMGVDTGRTVGGNSVGTLVIKAPGSGSRRSDRLELLRDSGDTGDFLSLDITNYRNGGSAHGGISFYAARGTEASPLALTSGRQLGTFIFAGHDGDAFRTQAQVECFTAEDWSATERGTYFEFSVTPAGSTTLGAVLRLDGAEAIFSVNLDLNFNQITETGDIFIGGDGRLADIARLGQYYSGAVTLRNAANTAYYPFHCGALTITGNLAASGNALRNASYLELDEITTPSALVDHGKVYTKNDNKLYFQDGAGVEHELAFVV